MTNRERDKKFRAERKRQLQRRTKIQKDTAGEVMRLLKEAEARTRRALAGAPTDWEKYYLPQLQRSIKAAMAEIAAQTAAAASKGSSEAWQAGLDLVDKPLAAGGLQIGAVLPQIDTGQLMAMRSFMTEKMNDVTLNVANKINSELGLVAIGAQPQSEALTKISQFIKTGGRARALRILRTELGRAYAVASQTRLEQAAAVLPGMQKEWRRSMKRQERMHHAAINGQIRKPDEMFRLANGVELLHPRHPAAPVGEVVNCGCESLPIMESWETTRNEFVLS